MQYDVFISAKSEDYAHARVVADCLRKAGLRVFFSEQELPELGNSEYFDAIDTAIENSSHMLVVTTSRDNVSSQWVKKEWQGYLNEKLCGRKTGNLVTVLCDGMKIDDLPFSLRQHEARPKDELPSVLKFFKSRVQPFYGVPAVDPSQTDGAVATAEIKAETMSAPPPARDAPGEENRPTSTAAAPPAPRQADADSSASPKPGAPVTLEHRRRPTDAAHPLPPISLLTEVPQDGNRPTQGDTNVVGRIIQQTLADFGLIARVANIECGPAVTRYSLQPADGVRVERIATLSNNIALAIKAASVRVQAPIPGTSMVGIEVPNVTASVVYLREILEGPEWRTDRMELPLALGKGIDGHDIVADLVKMPHLLIAGATGSGKTTCLNSILTGLVMSRTPAQLRLILIDPKIVEFSCYNGMPHLQLPVITDPKQAPIALRWALQEMEARYKLLARAGVRNIKNFNSRAFAKQPDMFGGFVAKECENGQPDLLPYIVIVIDELADLMLTVPLEIENSIARLAQLSRAVGIHMILATQRPSVNVITGTIKANFPARIAFRVTQKVDSRTILDAVGAETLLGQGDMLVLPPTSNTLVRTQGAMTTDADLGKVVEFLRKHVPPPPMPGEERADCSVGMPSVIAEPSERQRPSTGTREVSNREVSLSEMIGRIDLPSQNDVENELIDQAVQIIRKTRNASTSSLQRRLRIGYTRAARVMDILEARGIVGPPQGSDPREILIDLGEAVPDVLEDRNGKSNDRTEPGHPKTSTRRDGRRSGTAAYKDSPPVPEGTSVARKKGVITGLLEKLTAFVSPTKPKKNTRRRARI